MRSKVIKSLGVYGVLSFLPLASRFFLFPIFVNYLQPYDYGILGLHATIANLMTIVISCGLDSAFSRFYFDHDHHAKEIRDYFSTILILIFGIGFLFGGVLLIVGQSIYSVVFEDTNYTFFPYGIYSYLFAFGTSINAIILTYFRNKEQPFKYLLFAGSAFVLMIILEIVTVFYVEASADAVLIARLLGLFIPSIIVWVTLFSKFGITFRFLYLKKSFAYARPVFIYLLLGFVYLNYDRILVGNLLSISQLAIYSVAITIASVLEIFLQAIDMAILPTLYR
jgi:O-antigen/teichoic acid export membrane protein